MSVSVKNNVITITRGDTLNTKLTIIDQYGSEYVPVDGDVIRFAIKKKYSDPEPLFVKIIPLDTLMLHLDSEDTKPLDQPSEYVYDIQITLADGTVDTIIPKGSFKITEEVD